MNNNENKTTSVSQCQLIKDWLLAGNTITPLDALRLFGSLRLSGRIHDLREQGMNIKTEQHITPTGKRVARYRLEQL